MSANNGDVLRELAIAGHGMINLPLFLHYEALNRGLLRPLFTDYIWTNFDIFAVYQKPRFCPNVPVLLLILWPLCMGPILIGID